MEEFIYYWGFFPHISSPPRTFKKYFIINVINDLILNKNKQFQETFFFFCLYFPISRFTALSFIECGLHKGAHELFSLISARSSKTQGFRALWLFFYLAHQIAIQLQLASLEQMAFTYNVLIFFPVLLWVKKKRKSTSCVSNFSLLQFFVVVFIPA